MPKLHGANMERPGQGWCFHTQCHAHVPAHQVGEAGWANTQDQIPEMVSEYLPLIFLGELPGNLEAGGIKAKKKECVRAQQCMKESFGRGAPACDL